MSDATNKDLTNAGNENGDGAGAGQQQQTRTFTQADVDRIAAEARQSARSKAVTDLLAELQFKSADELKTLVSGARAQQEAQKTELERAQDRIKDLETAAHAKTELETLVGSYDEAIKAQVAALVKELSIPKYVTALLESMSPLEQLNYINANRTEFGRAAPPSTDASKRGGSQGNTTDPKAIWQQKVQSGRYSSL